MKCIKCGSLLPDGALFCPACGKKQTQKKKALKRANGTGTVYKLQGRRTRPWVAAKNKVVIGYYEKKTDALEALERLSGKSLTERYNMTFADVYEEWKKEHFKTIGKDGKKSYKMAYVIFKSLHNEKFRSLRTGDFQAVMDQHLHKSYSTVSKYKQLLTQMSQWAIREEICTTNFAKFVRLNENAQKEKEIFTEEEIQKLTEDGSECARIVLMLIYTGMRIGELLSLPLADYYGDYVIGGEKTEAGRNRIIPIRPEGKAHFAYFASQATGDLLLSGYTGHHTIDNFRRLDYYPLLQRLSIQKKSPHSTRHTYTSWAVKNGIAPEVLQKVLGHKNYSTTVNIYTHLDAETLVSAITSISVTNTLLANSDLEEKESP